MLNDLFIAVETTNPTSVVKIGSDRDITYRVVKLDENGQLVKSDIDHRFVRPKYEKSYHTNSRAEELGYKEKIVSLEASSAELEMVVAKNKSKGDQDVVNLKETFNDDLRCIAPCTDNVEDNLVAPYTSNVDLIYVSASTDNKSPK